MRFADENHRLVALKKAMREVVVFERQKDVFVNSARIEEQRASDHEHAAIDEADAAIPPDLPYRCGQRHAGKAIDSLSSRNQNRPSAV